MTTASPLTAVLIILALAIVLGWLTWASSDRATYRRIRRDSERRHREQDAAAVRMLRGPKR